LLQAIVSLSELLWFAALPSGAKEDYPALQYTSINKRACKW